MSALAGTEGRQVFIYCLGGLWEGGSSGFNFMRKMKKWMILVEEEEVDEYYVIIRHCDWSGVLGLLSH